MGQQLAHYLLEWLRANDPANNPNRFGMPNPSDPSTPSAELWRNGLDSKLRDFLLSASATQEPRGFEVAAESLRQRDPDLIRPLNRLVTWSMLTGLQCAFTERADRYDHLFGLPRFQGNLALISLNYDLLAEEALMRAGRDVCWPGPRDKQGRTGLPVFKPHGSVNWLRLFSTPVSATLAVAEQIAASSPIATLSGPQQGLDTGQEYIPPGPRNNLIWELKRQSNADQAILALYAQGKPVFTNHDCIAAAFDACVDAVRQNMSAGATLIGVSIPPEKDDPRLDAILGALRGLTAVDYVAPSPDDRASAQAHGFHLGAKTLEELVSAG